MLQLGLPHHLIQPLMVLPCLMRIQVQIYQVKVDFRQLSVIRIYVVCHIYGSVLPDLKNLKPILLLLRNPAVNVNRNALILIILKLLQVCMLFFIVLFPSAVLTYILFSPFSRSKT